MLSFIIIGKNEEKNIIRTVKSIRNLNLMQKYEIIYVDSNSEDDTIMKIKGEPDIKIIRINSNFYSAALGRNIGYKESKGDILFFLDADMEIKNIDIDYIVEEIKNDETGIVSGQLFDYIYDEQDKLVEKKLDRYKVNKSKEALMEPGGYFLIRRNLFECVKGFDNRIKCHEELDLFCRIIKKDKKLIRSNRLSVNHHNYKTINNGLNNEYLKFTNGFYSGIWITLIKNIKNGNLKGYFYFKGVIKAWIKRIIALGVLLLFVLSLINKSFIASCIIILINLIYTRFNIKKIFNVYSIELYIMFSLLKIFRTKKIVYTTENI